MSILLDGTGTRYVRISANQEVSTRTWYIPVKNYQQGVRAGTMYVSGTDSTRIYMAVAFRGEVDPFTAVGPQSRFWDRILGIEGVRTQNWTDVPSK